MQHVNTKRRGMPGFDPRLFLRDEELDHGISLILMGERLLMKQTQALAETLSLPPLAARVIVMTRFEPGLSVSHMRDHLGATVPTFARIIGDLGERGLIERRKSEGDARQRHLFLTSLGEEVTEPVVNSMRQALRGAYRRAGAGAVEGVRAVLEALE